MSEPIDFTTLPYKYDPKGREEYGIHPDLHILLCDLSIKLPKIAYESYAVSFHRNSDGSSRSDARVVSEVVVYNNEEKIGKIGITQDYVDGNTSTSINSTHLGFNSNAVCETENGLSITKLH